MTELMIWDDRNWDVIDENAEYNGDFVIVRKLFVRVAVNVSDKFIWIPKKRESELEFELCISGIRTEFKAFGTSSN